MLIGTLVWVCRYVESNVVPGLPFFASRLRLGPQGVLERLPLGPLNELEIQGLEVNPEAHLHAHAC